jgi:type II secretory pathway component GspD/PulD (secretin)
VSLLAITAHALAQDQPRVMVPESIKLSRLVDLTAEATGNQYSYAPSDLDSAVTLRVSSALAPAQLQELMFQVLASKGLTVVRAPSSPVLTVTKIDAAAGAATFTGATQGAGFVTEVITARHQPPKNLVEAIKPLLTKPGGAATVLGDSPLIAVSEFTSRMEEVRQLIARIDVPDAVSAKEVPLHGLGATQLVALATQVATKREAAGGRKLAGELIASADGASVILVCTPEAEPIWQTLIAQLDKREAVQSVTYTPRYFAAKDVSKLVETMATLPGTPADDRFRVVVDDLTGSLIVTATATQHERIAALLDRLDAGDHGPTPVRSFPIRNRPVKDVLDTLKQLIAAGILETDSGAARAEVTAGASQFNTRAPLLTQGSIPAVPTTATVGPQATTTRTSPGPSRPPLSLTADDSTNTLIAIGEPRMLTQLESLLSKLDVRQPQVMLEVTLVSLTDDDALTLGTELERLWKVGDTAVRLSSLFGLSTGPAPLRTVGDAAGFTGAVLNPGEYSVIVRALENVNHGRSLSNPKLLVSNNEKAVFSSTLQQPVQSLTRTGSNDSTFSYGGTENAGTTISVKPQIAQGDHLVLTYSIKLSSFVGTSSTAGLPPPKQENAVDSVATIPDGHTVVVGGLDLITDAKSQERIPWLGEIPGIGELFKLRNNSDSRTRFFVFIKATVLRSGSFEDLKYMSEADAKNAGVDDGFPEVLPRVIR